MWAAMLRAAAGLGVTPEAFWRLSLKEWRALTGREAAPSLSRDGFEALAARWPDRDQRHPGRSEAESRDLNAGSAELGPRIDPLGRPG